MCNAFQVYDTAQKETMRGLMSHRQISPALSTITRSVVYHPVATKDGFHYGRRFKWCLLKWVRREGSTAVLDQDRPQVLELWAGMPSPGCGREQQFGWLAVAWGQGTPC